MIDSFIKDLRNKENVVHMLLRALNFFMLIFLSIKIADYSSRAGINFGIIMSLMTLSVMFQAIVFWLFFGESLNWKTVLGIAVVLSGVALISIGKDGSMTAHDSPYSEQDRTYYRFLAVGLAIFTAGINASRVIQAKYLNRKNGYSAI